MPLFEHLQITKPGERWLVGTADLVLGAMSRIRSAISPSPPPSDPPRRILLLRLERIGDLLMTLDAIALVRRYAPAARIDLVVGSWNRDLAGLISCVDSVETLDLPWMARERPPRSWMGMTRQAWRWRSRHYDLAINFEPDIRSNMLLALSGATRRVGYSSSGGGDVLTESLASEPAAHVAANAERLIARAFPLQSVRAQGVSDRDAACTLTIPENARRAAAVLIERNGLAGRPIVGLQTAAGRKVKEWDPVRFAEVGVELTRARGVSVMLIGSAHDRAALSAVKAAWPSDVPLVELPVDTDLIGLAAMLERLALLITGDTGPMHLAALVGTPIVAVFGPSLPSRYAPLSARSTVVRIDLPCSPCNQMRHPPARCVGIVPDCLSGIQTAQVVRAAGDLLDRSAVNTPV